uniref:Uncharacterized protein n=1 Tax=Anopheles quadriannulatus TaxID=34691 RepID=A0A182XD61_ANOQN
MEVLEKMKYEMANYLLASTRPTIMHYSINYEREKFSEMRATFGRKKFPNTIAWLKRTLSSINSTHSGVVVGDASCSKNFQTIKLIDIHMPEYFVEPYQELIQIEKRYPLPELLEIDAGRLAQLKEQMFRLCACAASMQITFKSVPKHSQESNEPLITENKKISLHAQIVSINCRTSAYSSAVRATLVLMGGRNFANPSSASALALLPRPSTELAGSIVVGVPALCWEGLSARFGSF